MTIIAPKAATSRDHRIDFWRGVALVMIFFNHVPGTLWENFTSRNFGFSDAAELFVFLAGFAAAFAYGRPFLAGNRLIASVKAFRRAGVLYLVQMMLTMLAVGLFAWAAMIYGDGGFFQRINLESILLKPLDTMFGFAVLGHQLGYVNILPMYSVLLIMVPALLWLASKSLNLMLAASLILWVAAWTFRLDLPNYPNPGGWFFNPIAWQVIFAVGLYCGLRKASGRPSVPYRPWLFWSALAYLIGSFVVTEYGLWSLIASQQSWLPGILVAFDKTYVTAPRLLHVLALAYVFANAAPTSIFASISKKNRLPGRSVGPRRVLRLRHGSSRRMPVPAIHACLVAGMVGRLSKTRCDAEKARRAGSLRGADSRSWRSGRSSPGGPGRSQHKRAAAARSRPPGQAATLTRLEHDAPQQTLGAKSRLQLIAFRSQTKGATSPPE